MQALGRFYIAVFTFEMVVKMVAYGVLFHRNAYLRDAWCILDFAVVTLAWLLILFPWFGNFTAIRSVRALRPLRALKRMPGMPVLIASIFGALPGLTNIIALFAFLFLYLLAVLEPSQTCSCGLKPKSSNLRQ